jgi:hypothetical protein
MAIPIKDWVKQQKFTHYYIIRDPVTLESISEYAELRQWLTSSLKGKWSTKLVRVDNNNKNVGGIDYLPRCIILFDNEPDYTWFLLRWS